MEVICTNTVWRMRNECSRRAGHREGNASIQQAIWYIDLELYYSRGKYVPKNSTEEVSLSLRHFYVLYCMEKSCRILVYHTGEIRGK